MFTLNPEQTGLRLEQVSFTFEGNRVHALDELSLNLQPGLIHALLGENGAGKSSLARLCTGHLRPDSGRLILNGKTLDLRSPLNAMQHGIALVPQHPQVAGDLKVWENLVLGKLDDMGNADGLGVIRPTKIIHTLQERLDRWDIDIPLTAPARTLDSGRIHWTAIAEALLSGPCFLFLDEPGAAFAPDEISRLYALLRRLADSGMGIVIIGHRLQEILDYTDRIHVLRHGTLVGSNITTKETEKTELMTLMFGDVVAAPEADESRTPQFSTRQDNTLEIRNLSQADDAGRTLDGLTLSLAAGAIHGIVGRKDAGLELLEDLLSGMVRPRTGQIFFGALPLGKLPRIEWGYIPGRRFQRGIAPGLSIQDNAMARAGKLGWQGPKRTAAITSLSGGMIQRLIFERELSLPVPRLVIAAEPYWGLDRQNQLVLSQKLRALASAGSCVVFLSSDQDDAQEICDTIHVLPAGKIAP